MTSPDNIAGSTTDLNGAARELRRDGLRQLGIGLAILVAGVAITIYSYNRFANGGNGYVIAWGAVVFGAARAAIGAFRARASRWIVQRRYAEDQRRLRPLHDPFRF